MKSLQLKTAAKRRGNILPLACVLLPLILGMVALGANFNYDIVGFVGVKIVQPSDSNRQVVVQPVAINDPNMILNAGSIAPLSGSGSTSVTAMAPPKLTN